MGEAIPRWEWRTFGTRFPSAERYLANLEPTEVQDSDEIYLLSAHGDTVKIRSGLLDVKVLREVDDGGLERWEPVLKAEFPVSPAQLSVVFAALKVALPPLPRHAYTQDQLLAEVVEPHRAVRAVPVSKHRVPYSIEGCLGELSNVRIGDRLTRTIAIESEEREAVAAAVRTLGLSGRANTSYPRGLRAILDGEVSR